MQQPDPQAIAHLAQADLLLLAADLFRPFASGGAAPPLDAEIDSLLRAAGMADDAEPAAALRQLITAVVETPAQDRRGEYHRLFEGAMLCPLSETAYIRRDKGAIIGDLCGFYRAFGWSADPRSGEKADHLATQLQFMAVLLTMLAQARLAADTASVEVTEKAIRSFAEAHVSDFLPALCRQLDESTTLPLFQALAGTTLSLWSALAARHGFAFDPNVDVPALEPDEGSPFEPCGVGSGATPAPAPAALTVRGQFAG